MVIRRSIHEKTSGWPHLNENAFRKAKDRAAARMNHWCRRTSIWVYWGPKRARRWRSIRIPYGVKSNRKVLETVAQYSHEQGLTPRVMPMDEIFAPSTLDL